MKRLGIDIGSLSLNAVMIQHQVIVDRVTFEHAGKMDSAIRAVRERPGFSSFDTVGITGGLAGAGRGIIDNTLATIEGARFLLPGCRNVIAMGAQGFSLILLDDDGRYVEHAANPPCASGTGSFLEQQAERLGMGVKELADRAARFTGKAPRIASRCAVFAKTDIIHAMQQGHSLDAVSAGLCEGIARSMLDVLLKGRTLAAPVGLVGGVALNGKIASAIEFLLGLPVLVPDGCQCAGAIGAALLGAAGTITLDAVGISTNGRRQLRDTLSRSLADYPSFDDFEVQERDEVEIFRPRSEISRESGYYLGIDIGSTSTKAALTGRDGSFAAGYYTKTAGNPIGAVQRLLRVIGSSASTAPLLLGVATTGSGRAMVRQVFRADREVNEITAHAKAAVRLHPDVDTIIEIGGQDSKFTRIRDGEVYFSTMNYVCAAGTGSFIEEQAKRLGVDLAEFSDMATAESAPFTSDRCTVYMERDLSALLGEGWSRQALAAAVLHSVRDNYLSKVVGKSPLGDTIVFQGATARNRALVSAFEQHLGKTVHVSPYCHLTGALGAALHCGDEGLESSQFIWETDPIALVTEECKLCVNRCSLTVFERHGVKTAWGMKCGREYADRASPVRGESSVAASAPEKRFRGAMSPLYEMSSPGDSTGARQRRVITMGIPRGLYSFEYEPLWTCFLQRLGFSVEASDQRKEAVEQGAASVNSDFCAPMILAHGYVKQLLDRGVDYVFSPAIANEQESPEPDRASFRRRETDSAFCYYSQYLPSIVSKLTSFETGNRLISPLLPLREKSDDEIADLIHAELSSRVPGLGVEETREAYSHAAGLFRGARAELAGTFARESATESARRDKAAGEEPLRVVLLGRPYVAFDAVLSTSLPRTFEQLGASVFWQEELELKQFPLTYARQYEERMHWHYGRVIVRAAELAARTENLFPVFLTCFRCSPDSFIMSYVKDILTHFGKPFLFLQLDAHASDVGYLTRVEAALQSFRAHRARERARTRSEDTQTVEPRAAAAEPVVRARNDALVEGDTVLIPGLDTLMSRFWADAFIRGGNPALLLDSSASALSTGFRYASGGECTPLVAMVGSAIETITGRGLDPSRTFFFIPTVPLACNMPQFPIFADMAFRAAGCDGVKIGRINVMALADSLPQMLAVKILEGYIVACTLYKIAARIRPYETTAGETDKVLLASELLVREAIASGTELRTPLARAVELFRAISRDESAGRKPRVALLGDLYVKYNAAVNEGIQALVEELDGELIVSSMSEYAAHLLDVGARRYGEDPRSYRMLRTIEQRYEKLAEDLIGDQPEPDFAECVKLMEEYGILHYIPGETAISVGRALWYCAHGKVEAIVHVNPLFCCPGVVTASLYRRIQKEFGIPIVDIFYDGTADANRILIPHMHSLTHRR